MPGNLLVPGGVRVHLTVWPSARGPHPTSLTLARRALPGPPLNSPSPELAWGLFASCPPTQRAEKAPDQGKLLLQTLPASALARQGERGQGQPLLPGGPTPACRLHSTFPRGE